VTDRSSLRLVVLQVLVISLLLTLVGRLWYMQVITTSEAQAQVNHNSTVEVVTPAPRGYILDDKGRPLAQNTESIVITVDANVLAKRKDKGKPVLYRLARVLGTTYTNLYERTRRCGTDADAKPPECWSGSPFQPIPIMDNVSTEMALSVSEEREHFPGVKTQLETIRQYPEPMGANAAHELGYLGPATQQQIDDTKDTDAPITASDLVGKAGLEAVYDDELRGKAGVTTYNIDAGSNVIGTKSVVPPTPGDYLVTSIDAQVQKVAEDQLAAAIKRARKIGDINKQFAKGPADSGAVVVMDVKTGRIIAMASYPTYDPSVWVGGISTKDYTAITSKANDYPTLSRAYQGLYAPGSTFKIVSLPAAVKAGNSLYGTYKCPPSLKIGNEVKTNYEGETFPEGSLQQAIEVSCDTVFYKVAYDNWLREGGVSAPLNTKDAFTEMAKGFGLDETTGVDLTAESRSRIFDRQGLHDYWLATRADACKGAQTYPLGSARQALDAANCSPSGGIYQAGDAASFAIGQGSTVVTPLALTRAYAAVANGGTLWQPTIGKAIISPDGKVVQRITPKKVGTLPVTPTVLHYLQHALVTVVTGAHGTAKRPFADFPKNIIPIAAKTGTAEVTGKPSTTSWLASYAPADKPQYAVVMMVSEGGTGSGISGPSVAKIYDALFGVTSPTTVNPAKALMTSPPTTLPRIHQGRTPKPPSLPLIKAWVPNLANIPGAPLCVATAPDREVRTRVGGAQGTDVLGCLVPTSSLPTPSPSPSLSGSPSGSPSGAPSGSPSTSNPHSSSSRSP
jgi:penicillin-binding protein 2